MASLWHNLCHLSKQKRQALRSLGVGIVFFVTLYVLTKYFGTSLCPARYFFGIPCPGCGLTRAFIAILSFDIDAAVEYHILSVPLFLGIVAYCVILTIDVLFNRQVLLRVEYVLGNPRLIPWYIGIVVAAYIVNYL